MEHEIDAHFIVAAFGNDDVGVSFAGLDEFEVHGADSFLILLDDGFQSPAALEHVTDQAANEADIGVGIDEDLQVHQISQRFVFKNQNAFNQDCGARFNFHHLRNSAMLSEIVDGTFDGAAFAQAMDVLDEERSVKGTGMIEVTARALLKAQVRKVFVIMVLLEDQDSVVRQDARKAIGDGGFAGAGTSADANDEGALRHYALAFDGAIFAANLIILTE